MQEEMHRDVSWENNNPPKRNNPILLVRNSGLRKAGLNRKQLRTWAQGNGERWFGYQFFFECLSTCAYENGDNENKSAALKNERRGRELVRLKVYGGKCSVIMLTLNTLNKTGIMKYFENGG